MGQEETVRGRLYNKTHKGQLHFLLVRDGGGTVQAVAFRPDVPEPAWQACEDATQESSIIVTGLVREDRRAPGRFELSLRGVQPQQIAVYYPIPPDKHGVGSPKRNGRWWQRSSRQHPILGTSAAISAARFLETLGCARHHPRALPARRSGTPEGRCAP